VASCSSNSTRWRVGKDDEPPKLRDRRQLSVAHDRNSCGFDPTWVSRCCASDFSLLAQRKGAKRKGTLHCVDAVHRFLALLARKGAAGNSLRSNIRLLFPFLAVLLSASAKGLNTATTRLAPWRFSEDDGPRIRRDRR